MRTALLTVVLLASALVPRVAAAEGDTNWVVGVEGGVAQLRDSNLPAGDALATGKAFIFGYRYGGFSMELQTLQSYSHLGENAPIDAANTRGAFKVTTAGIRFALPIEFLVTAVYAGVGRYQVPVVVRVDDEFTPTYVKEDTISGVGPVLGVGGGLSLFDGMLQATLEARVMKAWWAIPGHPYATQPFDNGDGTVVVTYTTADIDPIPVTLTGALRFFF